MFVQIVHCWHSIIVILKQLLRMWPMAQELQVVCFDVCPRLQVCHRYQHLPCHNYGQCAGKVLCMDALAWYFRAGSAVSQHYGKPSFFGPCLTVNELRHSYQYLLLSWLNFSNQVHSQVCPCGLKSQVLLDGSSRK